MLDIFSSSSSRHYQRLLDFFRSGRDDYQLAPCSSDDPPNRSRRLKASTFNITFALILLTISSLAVCGAVLDRRERQPSDSTGHTPGHWIDTWSAVPQSFNASYLPSPFVNKSSVFTDSTIRQTVQISVGSSYIRIRISNAFGTSDLPIERVRVGLALPQSGHYLGSSLVDNNTTKSVTFSDSEWLIIPDGALAVSNPIHFSPSLEPGAVLSISMHIRDGQEGESITSHVLSLTTSWLAPGDHTAAEELQGTKTNPHWVFIGAVEAWAHPNSGAFAILGDSITDGRGVSHMNSNTRWPSFLFRRMQASSNLNGISIANQGAGGTQLLHDGKGPNAASRIDRDLLAQSGLKYAMLFEGVNDIGWAGPTESQQKHTEARLIHSYKQIITRVHTMGLPIFGGITLQLR